MHSFRDTDFSDLCITPGPKGITEVPLYIYTSQLGMHKELSTLSVLAILNLHSSTLYIFFAGPYILEVCPNIPCVL